MAVHAGLKIEENSDAWQSIVRLVESLKQGQSYVKAGVCGPAASVIEGHGEVAHDARDASREAARAYERDSGRKPPTKLVKELANEAAAEGSHLTNAQLAAIHEFGSPAEHIPARPFINGTFDLHRGEYIKQLRELIRKVYETKITIPFALRFMGEKIASDMRSRMVEGAGIPPPNAESTIRQKLRKGAWKKRAGVGAGQEGPGLAPRPLVDTGRLRQSITYEVVIKGDE